MPEGGRKPDEADGSTAAASNPSKPPQIPLPPIPPPGIPGVPPLTQAGIPQLMAVQLGIGMQQQQQNPEVVRYMTEFLSHDSDNRLAALTTSGGRDHKFRMTVLIIVAVLAGIVLLIPLVALYRGDMDFVKEFLQRYFPDLLMVALALLAGAKLPDFFKS